jgi:fatty-acyl-CoA synthase
MLTPTPTRNASLLFRRGGFGSLCQALDYAAKGETGLNFFDARGRLLDSLPYRDLRHRAQSFARRLIGAEIARGERLLMVADTCPEFCIAFFGAQYAGVVPVPVSVPVGLGSKTSYIEHLKRNIQAAGAVGILAPEELAAYVVAAAEGTTAHLTGSLSAVEASLPDTPVDMRPLSAGEQCYVQFSSGSTRLPLGVDVRQDQLMANIDGSITRQELNEDDSGVSWLPLYHDMGLIGFVLAPMCAQRSVDLMAPHEFARRPLQWLSLVSRRRASITYSPSFGYDLVARRAQTQALGNIDLSCLRLAGIGADMIQVPVLERFSRTFEPVGFDARAFLPSYGMAEVCVGLTFGRRFDGFKVDTIDASRIGMTGGTPAVGRAGKQRAFVVCGQVLAGHRVEIRGENGEPLPARRVGRLFAQGPSVMPGYFREPIESAKVLDGGWLDTGDLGYWFNDEIVVTGRAKDLIIVNGRNIWPQDIEWAVEALPQLRRGDACAFSVESDTAESVILIVQCLSPDLTDRELLVGDVRQVMKEAVGIDCQIVLISRQVGLPLTSSGKLSRVQAKSKFIAGGYFDDQGADAIRLVA